MRRVSGQENVADAITVGNDGRCLPRADAQHRYGKVRHADAFPDQCRTKFWREVLRLPAVFFGAVNQETPAISAVDREECPPQPLLLPTINPANPTFPPLRITPPAQ